jgi:hypothetical protein
MASAAGDIGNLFGKRAHQTPHFRVKWLYRWIEKIHGVGREGNFGVCFWTRILWLI